VTAGAAKMESGGPRCRQAKPPQGKARRAGMRSQPRAEEPQKLADFGSHAEDVYHQRSIAPPSGPPGVPALPWPAPDAVTPVSPRGNRWSFTRRVMGASAARRCGSEGYYATQGVGVPIRRPHSRSSCLGRPARDAAQATSTTSGTGCGLGKRLRLDQDQASAAGTWHRCVRRGGTARSWSIGAKTATPAGARRDTRWSGPGDHCPEECIVVPSAEPARLAVPMRRSRRARAGAARGAGVDAGGPRAPGRV